MNVQRMTFFFVCTMTNSVMIEYFPKHNGTNKCILHTKLMINVRERETPNLQCKLYKSKIVLNPNHLSQKNRLFKTQYNVCVSDPIMVSVIKAVLLVANMFCRVFVWLLVFSIDLFYFFLIRAYIVDEFCSLSKATRHIQLRIRA